MARGILEWWTGLGRDGMASGSSLLTVYPRSSGICRTCRKRVCRVGVEFLNKPLTCDSAPRSRRQRGEPGGPGARAWTGHRVVRGSLSSSWTRACWLYVVDRALALPIISPAGHRLDPGAGRGFSPGVQPVVAVSRRGSSSSQAVSLTEPRTNAVKLSRRGSVAQTMAPAAELSET